MSALFAYSLESYYVNYSNKNLKNSHSSVFLRKKIITKIGFHGIWIVNWKGLKRGKYLRSWENSLHWNETIPRDTISKKKLLLLEFFGGFFFTESNFNSQFFTLFQFSSVQINLFILTFSNTCSIHYKWERRKQILFVVLFILYAKMINTKRCGIST